MPTAFLQRLPNISTTCSGCRRSFFNFYLQNGATQHYCCVVIPKSVDINGIWNVLPPGVHNAALEEIEQRFVTNEKRKTLFEGFRKAVEILRAAGCKAIFLDGSFVTDKPEPGDFDMCWDPTGVDPGKLDPVFLDFSNRRKLQKDKFGGEFFPSGAKADATAMFLEFFQKDKYSGRAKGIIKVQFA
jgi:hypothetical protein